MTPNVPMLKLVNESKGGVERIRERHLHLIEHLGSKEQTIFTEDTMYRDGNKNIIRTR